MSRKLINGIVRESTDVRINGISDFFASEGDIVVNGQEHYDFFRRYGVSATSLKLWLDQAAITAGISVATWSDLSGLINDMKQATASYQPSLSNTFMKDASRDFDGVDNYMQQKEYDDETGATFWPTNAGGIFAATKAAFRVAGVDLSPFASADNDYMLVIHDSADKTAWGYIDVADSALAYGTELIAASDDRDFTVWGNVNWAGWSGGAVADGTGKMTVTMDATASGAYLASHLVDDPVVGELLEFSADVWQGTTAETSFEIRMYDGVSAFAIKTITIGAGQTNYKGYVVAAGGVVYVIIAHSTGDNTKTFHVDNAKFRKVTNVGTDGVLIMSTKGGSTQSWALQEAGIDLNDIDSFEVLKTTNQITAALSAFMWVKLDDGQSGLLDVLISKHRAVNDFRGWILRNNADGKLAAYLSGDGTVTVSEISDDAFFANGQETWHHMGFTYDGITIVLYGDGVALASTTGGSVPVALYDTSEKLTIGALSTPVDYLAGLIGPTVLASRAYSAGEASRLFNADRARFGV